MALNVFHSFYSKLSLGLLASFILIGLVLLQLAQYLTQQHQIEVEQKLHKNLAYHVVKDNDLLKNGEIDKRALKHAFHNMMILGPDFEFYLLDPDGQIKTYSADPDKIKRQQVSIHAIQTFLADNQALPILGDDPRSPSKQKIFSVAPIYHGEALKGYLYIIIGGEIYDSITELIKNSHNMTLAAWGLLFTLLFGLAVSLLLFALLTRPLRKLNQDIQRFRHDANEIPKTQWKDGSADEIQRLGCAFNDMVQALTSQYQKVKNTDEIRRELISYVSHDLRTPLAALQGYLETWQLKQSQHDDAEGRKLIDVAMKNAQQMSRLIEQLFELAHLDADNVTLETEPVMIAELAQDVLMKFELQAQSKSIQLNLDVNDPTVLIQGNIEKLERVLTNLIDNAIRHCETNDVVTVKIEKRTEQGEHGKQGETANKVIISVEDTGVGIKTSEHARIFENHYRASNSVSGKGTNSGLGLAICSRVIELHGSKLKVKSQIGEGSEFYFSLPA